MKTIAQIQEILEKILGSDKVYYQPPENVKIKYPCIIYETGNGVRTPADNKKYLFDQGYSVTYITKNPEQGQVQNGLLELPYCQPERTYKFENLYHWVYFIYF